jgi:YidC/Oxa1 family membrane protein insertase
LFGEIFSEQDEEQTETVAVPVLEPYAGHTVHIKTDVFELEIDTKGGTFRSLDLLDYPQQKENPYYNKVRKMVGFAPKELDLNPVRLFNSSEEKLFLGQSGLIPVNGSASVPKHHSELTTDKDDYL